MLILYIYLRYSEFPILTKILYAKDTAVIPLM